VNDTTQTSGYCTFLTQAAFHTSYHDHPWALTIRKAAYCAPVAFRQINRSWTNDLARSQWLATSMESVLHSSVPESKHIRPGHACDSKYLRPERRTSKGSPDPKCLTRDRIKPPDPDPLFSIVQVFHFFHCVGCKVPSILVSPTPIRRMYGTRSLDIPLKECVLTPFYKVSVSV
jgi:hypothetical protein